MTQKNTGHLLSVYCPECRKVTDKISFNLLREAGKVTVLCPQCQRATYLEYDGKSVTIFHQDDDIERLARSLSSAVRDDSK